MPTPDDDPSSETPFAHESDTAEPEEASCSWDAFQTSILPPHGRLPSRASSNDRAIPPANFAVHVNGAAWAGWVRQSSPACAAASVAGAWNALACGGRHASRAVRQDDVVAHLERCLEEQIRQKRARFERLLGAPTDEFEAELDAAIARDPSGKTLGGRSKIDKGMKRADVMRVVVDVAKEHGTRELDARDAAVESAAAAAAAAAAARETIDEAAEDGEPPPPPPPPDLSRVPKMSAFGLIAALVREDEARAAAAAKEEEEEEEEEEEDDEDESANDENAEDANAETGAAGDAKTAPGAVDEDAALLASLAAGIEMNSGRGGKGKGGKKKPPSRFAKMNKKFLAGFGGAELAETANDAGGGRVTTHADALPPDHPSAAAAAAVAVAAETEMPPAKPKRWTWRKDLCELLKKRGGLEKLRRDKPSTGEFGNWGIIEAMRRVSAHAALAASEDVDAPPAPQVSVRVAVGAKTKLRKRLDVVVRARGDEEEEWEKLRALFARDDTVLIFHLKNHYALIYALRESTVFEEGDEVDGGGGGGGGGGGRDDVSSASERAAVVVGGRRRRRVRELLTARRGQRPTAWVPWSEARETMLRWTGYGILAASVKR